MGEANGFFNAFSDKEICFAINARSSIGGQGEFLRQMEFVLDQLPRAIIFSRFSKVMKAKGVDFPFSSFPNRFLADAIMSIRLLRRGDWVTLLSDLDFDKQVMQEIREPSIFDGIMAQCCNTFIKLKDKNTKLILTSLNTHIDYLIEALNEEHWRIRFRDHHFVSQRMRERALKEIELADFIRVNSKWSKQTFVERGVPEGKIHVIYPSVDKKHFYPVEKKDNVFRVLAVSTIQPRKGIYYLLQAFEEAKIPNSELVLIGGTCDRWSWKMLKGFLHRNSNIKHHIIDVATRPVEESYGVASVLVHPAIEDGYGLVIAQALASGRPVIATRQSGASELIHDGENGFVIERRSIQAMKNHLLQLANDKRFLESMGRNAYESVSNLSYQKFSEEVLIFYKELLN